MSWLHPGDKKRTWPNITKDARNENKKNCTKKVPKKCSLSLPPGTIKTGFSLF